MPHPVLWLTVTGHVLIRVPASQACMVSATTAPGNKAELLPASFITKEEDNLLWFKLHAYFRMKSSLNLIRLPFTSVQFSLSVVSDSLWPHGLQHARPPCSSPTPVACSNSCPSSQWCHPTISSSVIPFSSCRQSFPASRPFPMSQFFSSGGQGTGVSASASVLPMNVQDWSPLGWTGWISLQSKGLSRVFSNTTVRKHQFFGIQLSL